MIKLKCYFCNKTIAKFSNESEIMYHAKCKKCNCGNYYTTSLKIYAADLYLDDKSAILLDMRENKIIMITWIDNLKQNRAEIPYIPQFNSKQDLINKCKLYLNFI